MAQVIVHNGAARNSEQGETTGVSPFLPLERVLEAVRRRAFSIFEERGSGPGQEVEDWLRAESELLISPVAEVDTDEQSVTIRAKVNGFTAPEIHVLAWPGEILVTAQTEKDLQPADGVESKSIYCRLAMPAPIDPSHVKATLAKGALTIHAPRADSQPSAIPPASGEPERAQAAAA